MVVLLNLKKYGIVLLFLIILTSVSSGELQNNSNVTNTESNIVIVIDASGSTGIGSPSPISLIQTNAIYAIQNVASDTLMAIVAFGGSIAHTDIIPINNEANKAELKKFIQDNVPKEGANPTNLGEGLLAAEKLLYSENCTRKKIIVLSDGLTDPKELTQTKNKMIDFKNKGIKIYFIQVLLPDSKKIPNDNYDILAKAADGSVILLYPNERVPKSVLESEEPCSTYIVTPTNTPTVTITSIPKITSSTLKNESNLEQEVKDLKERLNKLEENQLSRKSWYEYIIDWIKSIF